MSFLIQSTLALKIDMLQIINNCHVNIQIVNLNILN